MSEEIRAEHTEDGWEIHVDQAERAQGGETLTLLGLVAVCDPEHREDNITFESIEDDIPVFSTTVPLTEETELNVDFIRDQRAAFIQLHGQDATQLRVHPDEWDDIEAIVAHLERPRYGNFVSGFQEPARDPEPRGRIETFRPDVDLTQEQWLYPEGLVTMAGANNCRSAMRLEAIQEYDRRNPHAQVSLRIPEMQIMVTTNNAPIPEINWRSQSDVDAYYRSMRRRVFKHVTAYLRAEFERHKRANPQGRRSEIPF